MAKRLAENEGVEINTYSIIYDAIDEIKSALEGMLEPKQVEEITGMVDVQQVFKISKVGAVAGCFVQEGKVTRNSYVRVIRDGIVEYPKKKEYTVNYLVYVVSRTVYQKLRMALSVVLH